MSPKYKAGDVLSWAGSEPSEFTIRIIGVRKDIECYNFVAIDKFGNESIISVCNMSTLHNRWRPATKLEQALK